MKKLLMMALLGLTACDYVEKSEFRRERADRVYRAAMEDYRAGRLGLALDGFRKVCKADPANASARFQLACLLQDSEKDFSGAYCAYGEYLLQCPDSEKAKLASDRMLECEREMASSLSTKYGLNRAQESEQIAKDLRASLEKAERRLTKLTKDLQSSMRRTVALQQENERLKGVLEAETRADDSEGAIVPAEIEEAKDLLEEIKSSPKAAPTAETAKSEVDEAKALLDELQNEKPLIRQDPQAKVDRDTAREQRQSSEAEMPLTPARPDTYVVQEGDTLYKIALKFYGRSSVWTKIREANKATISTDGRVRVGQKIVLPPE